MKFNLTLYQLRKTVVRLNQSFTPPDSNFLVSISDAIVDQVIPFKFKHFMIRNIKTRLIHTQD